MDTNFRVSIAMSLMRALWGEIATNVRAVLARVGDGNVFTIEFYMDGGISEEFADTAACIETEVIADFPDTVDISHKLIRLDAPAKVPVGDGILVYLRKEPDR